MQNNDEPRRGKPVVALKLKGRAPIARHPSPESAPALATSAQAAPAVQLDESLARGAGAEALRNDPANDLGIPSNDVRPNGDEVDVRMAEIDEILRHAAMRHLQKSLLAAEWVHHAETKLSVVGQAVQKPGCGRPEGGLTRAARELSVPGDTPAARRKYLDRAIKIAEIWPEAQSAACNAGLDNNKSALLAVARERSLAAQLARVQEIAARKAMPRRNSTGRNRGEGTAVENAELPSTVSDDTSDKQDELAVAPEGAPAPEAVATAAVVAGSVTPPPNDEDIPAFLDRRLLSAEDRRVFDIIMSALHSASAVVRARVRAEILRDRVT